MVNHNYPGVKVVSIQKWMEAGRTFRTWRQMTYAAKTEAQWAEFFLEQILVPKVNVEILRLLEAILAAMMKPRAIFH